MTETPPPLPTDLRNTLEEMRASVVAEGARRGLAGAVQEAFLKLLEVLITLLVEFRAGRLAPPAPVAEEAPQRVEPCATGAGSAGNGLGATVGAAPSRACTAEDAEHRGGSRWFRPSNSLHRRGDERGGDGGGFVAGAADEAAVASGAGLPAEPRMLRAPLRAPRSKIVSADGRRGFPAGAAAAAPGRRRNTPGIRRALPRYGPDSKNRGRGAANTCGQFVAIS